MARKNSEFLSALGKMFEIWKLILHAVLDLGGSDEDLSRLLTDPTRVREIAKIIVGKREEVEAERKFQFLPLVSAGKVQVFGDEVIRLCGSLAGREATQEDGEYLLANQHLIPAEYRGAHFPVITGWRHLHNSRSVAFLYWYDGQWMLDWSNLGYNFHGFALAVRLSE
jgi:hypothetical protein